jgi:hypothetical protein
MPQLSGNEPILGLNMKLKNPHESYRSAQKSNVCKRNCLNNKENE